MKKKIFRIFLCIVLFSIYTSTSAATVNVVTKYGLTGELKGVLNNVGDLVNDVNVCPAVNTNANGTPGCDMDSDSGFQDNGTPDDGSDDSYTGDLIVRTHDAFEAIAGWNWGNNTGDGEEVVTIIGTLPTGTGSQFPFEWDQLPAICDAVGSGISTDGQTITCVRSNFDTNGVGSYSEDIPFPVKVRGGAMNGEAPGDINFEISSLNATNVSDDTNNTSIIVTAAPRWNLSKTRDGAVTQTTFNGQEGVVVRYSFFIGVNEISGTNSTISGVFGNEGLTNNESFTFLDDVSGISSNAELVSCGDVLSGSSRPYTSFDPSFPERSMGTPAGQIIVSCTQAGGVGTDISMSISGLDATLNNVPTQDRSGGSIPITTAYAGLVFVEVFVPTSDIIAGDDGVSGTNDDGNLDIFNEIAQLPIVSPSGQANYAGQEEPLGDNTTSTFTINGFRTLEYKNFTSSTGIFSPSGGEIVSFNEERYSRVYMRNVGVLPLDEPQMCDVFDANHLELIPYNPAVISGSRESVDPYVFLHLNNSTLDPATDFYIEYASTYENTSWIPSYGASLYTNYGNTGIVADECLVENSVGNTIWHPTSAAAITDPAGLGTITKYRIRTNSGARLEPGADIYSFANTRTRSQTLTGMSVDVGSIIVNYGDTRSLNYQQYGPRGHTFRDINENQGGGGYGDRLFVMGGIVRLAKDANLTNMNLGDNVEFTLSQTFTSETGTATGSVIIKDILPTGLSYIPFSSTGALTGTGTSEPTLGTCADVVDMGEPCTANDTVLIWDLGTLTTNVVIPDITYSAIANVDTPSGILENWAMIESPLDISPIDLRKDNANVNIVIPTSLLIAKTVESDPVVLRDVSPGHWQVGLRNGSSVPLTNLDVIDVLPFNGDNTLGIPFTVAGTTTTRQRVPATSYNGTQTFQSMNLTGVCTGTPTYWFTNASPETVDLAPSHTTNTTGSMPGTPTGIWCQGTATGPDAGCGYTNTAVTAVRMRGVDMPADGTCYMDVFTDVSGNADGDIYTNNAGAFAGGVSNPVLSNDVTYRVVDTAPRYSLGDTIWIDTDRDGILNNGELGYSGATVNLLTSTGVVLDTQLTTSTGGYLFTDLNDGNYIVELVVPSGYLQTIRGSGPDDTEDSDFSLVDQRTGIIIISGADDLTNDGGIYLIPRVSLGGTIWLDGNNNTMYASGSELPFNNVTVELYNGSGTLVATGSTNPTGDYLFENLLEGDYYVSIPSSNFGPSAVLENYNSSDDTATINDPDNDTKFEDNGLQAGTGSSSVITSQLITLSEGNEPVNDGDTDNNSNLTVDFGVYQTVSLGNYVWYDTNMDGIQDPTELGYSGATLNLLNASGATIATTMTNGSGAYLFSDLEPGDYFVEILPIVGYTLSPSGAGTDIDDSNFDRTSRRTTTIILISPNDNLTIDAGIFQLQNMSLGGTIWSDANNDTLFQTGSELPVEGVQVDLYEDTNGNGVYDTGDVFFVTSNTDSSGNYLFTNLTAGEYVVYLPNTNFAGGAVLEDYRSSDDNLTINDPDNDTKNEDNGLQTGSGTSSTISSQAVTLIQDTEPTNDGDSDTNSNLTIDFGVYTPLGAISGSVTEDTTGNGLGDTPLENVTLELFLDTNSDGIADSPSTPLQTTNTNASGSYIFENLPLGDYLVIEIQPVNLDNVSQDEGGSDDDQTIASIVLNTLTASVTEIDTQNTSLQHEDTNNDFVEARPSISLIKSITNVYDTVSDSFTGSGDTIEYSFEISNTGPTVLRNITVTDPKLGLTAAVCSPGPLNPGQSVTCSSTGSYVITLADVITQYVVNTATTDADSESIVDGTPGTPVMDVSDTGTEPTIPGEYQIVTDPETVETTDPDPSITDSDTDFTEDPTTLTLEGIGSISGSVTQDTTFDGNGDNPLENISIALYEDSDADGIADSSTPLATTTTNSTGFYIFDDLVFGSYVIVEAQPNGFESISQDEGGADDDATSSTIIIDTLTVTLGGTDPDRVDVNNDFIERRPSASSSSGGGGSSSGGFSSTSTPNTSSVSTPSTPTPISPPAVPTNIQDKLLKYEQKIEVKKQIIVNTKGDSLLKSLPKTLPKTGTPISERVSTISDSNINTELPSSEIFTLARTSNADVDHWKQVLVEEDRDATKYIVIPSNGLVMPINEFVEGSNDFNTMINGREGNINPALRTGALEYPGTSTKGYGDIGNKVIFGHSSYFRNAQGRYKTHFQKIIELDAGEEIWVYEKQNDGSYTRYRYETEKSYNTDDSDTSVLLPGEGKNLTLFTCTPIGGVEGRWIIKAKYIEEGVVYEDEENMEDNIQIITEERDYFYNLSTKYKLIVSRFIQKIESIEDAGERREMYIKIMNRIEEVLPNYSDNADITLILEYLDYRVIQKLLEL